MQEQVSYGAVPVDKRIRKKSEGINAYFNTSSAFLISLVTWMINITMLIIIRQAFTNGKFLGGLSSRKGIIRCPHFAPNISAEGFELIFWLKISKFFKVTSSLVRVSLSLSIPRGVVLS